MTADLTIVWRVVDPFTSVVNLVTNPEEALKAEAGKAPQDIDATEAIANPVALAMRSRPD